MAGSSNQLFKPKNFNIAAAILVAALGYFVDIFDLLLFGIVQNDSLRDLGYEGQEMEHYRHILLDLQMVGMLIGGVLWGVLGDKKGRLQVLFGSILLYSLANIANGFVTDIYSYMGCRFIAGIGLAGELGAGITLVSELMPKHLRGIGTTIVAAVGLSGAVVGGLLKESGFEWRTLYYIGGGLGIALLLLRVGVTESGMFSGLTEDKGVRKGNFFALFTNKARLRRYAACIALGFPTWYVIGILIFKCDKLSEALGVVGGPADPALAIPICYVGLVLGDIFSGLLSQFLKSRKKVLLFFLVSCTFFVSVFFLFSGSFTLQMFYGLCFALGLSVGYWVIFVTTAAEQFGTNIRATVTTSVPNFVRGGEAVMSQLFLLLFSYVFVGQRLLSAAVVGIIFIGLAFWALTGIKESFHEDLDYVEDM